MTLLPPHAYVPGQTPRHAEDAFDGIKATVAPGLRSDQIAQTEAWRAGLEYLDAGFYWEAHEVLEAVWMICPPNSVERIFVQCLIQLANAALKRDMGRAGAARRLFDHAQQLERECIMSGRTKVFGLPVGFPGELRAKLDVEL